MSRWEIKKRWYSRQMWVLRRIISVQLVLVMFFGPAFPFAAFAGTDTFLGDSAIYAGDPAIRPKPKILFLIDNSQSTLNSSAGSKYYPGVPYPVIDNQEPWDIYYAGTSGSYDKLAVDNDSFVLENLTSDACADIIRTALLTTGVYAGSGTPSSPNIKNNECDASSPIGIVYALGNFINYTGFLAGDDDDDDGIDDEYDVCRGHRDDFTTVETYYNVASLYNAAGLSVPDYLPNGVDVLLYDMDEDGVPNGLPPGTPWEDGCDVCIGYDDTDDFDGDEIPDGCDTDDDNDSVSDKNADGTDNDNCPFVSNFDQIDTDGDGEGNVCDDDDDGDGVLDENDNCPLVANGIFEDNQLDDDNDGIGDACDSIIDTDFDGYDDSTDNCVFDFNPDQADFDKGVEVYNAATLTAFGGDACDIDDDNDGVPDATDKCTVAGDLAASDDTIDTDGDGIPDG
ncbi:MAG: thrombospondin type 3 repeat-containing protein, partial [Desulfuromonadales bacterium]|nr:thrombospondin type 3 repeat-containing protein [Desulfuromonadales bacterium]